VRARGARPRVRVFAPGDPKPLVTAALEPVPDARGAALWAAELVDLPEVFEYGFLVGERDELLLDPLARAVTGGERWGDRAHESRGRRFRAHRSLHLELPPPGDAARPAIDPGARAIYELHVRGFTRHPSSRVAQPGTYAGVAEKIPHLLALGVTTVELLPVFEFDETENWRTNPETGERLLNFWGYAPISFFAPKAGYAASTAPGAALGEFRALVAELHRAGLEVILDVVYNHTGESARADGGPVVSWAGLDRSTYYLLDAAGQPIDVTGCGNTVKLADPVVAAQVLASLRFWRREMGVDGFRFDLAAAFYRDPEGRPTTTSALVESIATDPDLADALLVAEPWDVTGQDLSGRFPAPWFEWNGRFRDTTRRAVAGEVVAAAEISRVLAGSPEKFRPPRGPRHAIDFITCHDGFTLADLVAYEKKRNLANGEQERDGSPWNFSSNSGSEGPSADPAVVGLRRRQRLNFLALLWLARGTPLLLGGDELGRTQRGNNNAWCQDNEIGWLAWPAEGEAGELVAEIAALARLRRELYAGGGDWKVARISPLGAGDGEPAALVWLARSEDRARALLLAANFGGDDLVAPLPRPPANRPWRLRVDTTSATPVPPAGESPALAEETSEIRLPPRSVRAWIAKAGSD
jgi:glycogen operon protein